MASKRATLPNDFGAVMERNNLDELRAVFENACPVPIRRFG